MFPRRSNLISGLEDCSYRVRLLRTVWPAIVVGTGPLFAGCDGIQSALEPAGREAEQIGKLFWWMTGGAFAVWVAVLGLGIYAVRSNPVSAKRSSLMIIGGGAVIPTFVLAGLLIYGLRMLPRLVASAPEGSLKIHVSGEQWWWRVRYDLPDRAPVHLANEIRLPLGQPVEFILESSDVIHSFWIPSLGGKRDMIPGRVTRLVLTPTKTGMFRGVCAEYCGTSHALMSFYVTVVPKAEFALWLEDQAGEAQAPATEPARRGQEQFLANGCGACHAIRGSPAKGVIGPDLTHAGGRLSLAAGILTNEPSAFERWISQPHLIKPGVQMPSFGMLPQSEREAIALYLEGLK